MFREKPALSCNMYPNHLQRYVCIRKIIYDVWVSVVVIRIRLQVDTWMYAYVFMYIHMGIGSGYMYTSIS